jgi:hypothetical protein
MWTRLEMTDHEHQNNLLTTNVYESGRMAERARGQTMFFFSSFVGYTRVICSQYHFLISLKRPHA